MTVTMTARQPRHAVDAGVDEPDSGAVRKRGTTVGYLPQSPELDEGLSAIDAILHSGSILARCVLAYEKAIASGNQKVIRLTVQLLHLILGSPKYQLSHMTLFDWSCPAY